MESYDLAKFVMPINTAIKWRNNVQSSQADQLDSEEAELFVKVGDCISLFSVDQHGYLSANGFDDQGCQLKKPPNVRRNSSPLNFQECVFEIYPKFKYDAQIYLEEALSNLGREKSSIGKLEQGKKDEEEYLMLLKKNAELEVQENESEFYRSAEKNINYGQIVQLRHKKSQKFLSVDMKESAEIDKDCHKVTLVDNGNEGSWFIITPRLKMRSEGEPVMMGDQIIMVSKKYNRFLNVTCNMSRSEINASSSICSWRIIPYASYTNNAQYLKAGDMIRIFHKEIEGYMTNEYHHEDIVKREMTDRLYFEVNINSDDFKYNFESSNSNSLWEIECENTMRGGIINLSKLYRFKHIATGKYLAVREYGKENLSNSNHAPNYVITTINDPNSAKCLFSIHLANSPNQKEGFIRYDEYLRLKHHETKCWIHASTEDLDGHNNGNIATGKVNIHLSLTQCDMDVYSFKSVSSHEITALYKVLCEITVIRLFLSRFGKAHTTGYYENDPKMFQWMINDSKKVIKVMESLIEACKANNYSNTKMQNLLREQNNIDVLLQLINNYSNIKTMEGKKFYEPILFLCQTSFRLLKQLLIDNPTNRLYMINYVPIIRSQIGYSFKATSALKEIYRNNKPLLNTVDEELIFFFVTLIKKRPLKRYLKFLKTICSCDGYPLPKNQDLVCKYTVDQNPDMFIPLKIDRESGIINIKLPDFEKWMDIESFIDLKNKNYLSYFLNSIELLSSICFGGNNYTCSIILKVLPLKGIIQCLKNNFLPSPLRSAFVHLSLNILLADKEVTKSVNFLNYTRLWTDVSKELNIQTNQQNLNDDLVQPSQLMSNNFESIVHPNDIQIFKDYINEYLKSLKVFGPGSEDNSLTCSVLLLYRQLFIFGHFTTSEKNKFQDLLIKFLSNNIFPDVYIHHDTKLNKYIVVNTYERSNLTSDIMGFKYHSGQIFNMLMDYCCDQRLSKLLTIYKDKVESLEMKHSKDDKIMIHDFDSDTIISNINDVFKIQSFDDNSYISILKDMIYQNYPPLANIGAKLLIRYFNQKKEILNALKSTQILADPNLVETYQKVIQSLDKLRSILTTSSQSQDLTQSNEYAIQSLNLLISLCNDSSKIKDCQKIFYNLKVHETIIEVMKGDLIKTNMNLQKLCFDFMTNFCYNNYEGQLKLFKYYDFLIEYIDNNEQIVLHGAKTIKQLFTNNQTISSQISEAQVRKILHLICRKRLPIYLDCLKELIIYNGNPIRRNQNLMIKLLLEKQNDVIVLYNDVVSIQKRNEMINKFEYLNDHSEIVYFMKLMDLFFLCCKGRVYESEVKCQSLFPIEDILTQIKDTDNYPKIKSLYLQLFDEIYLITERKLKNITNKTEFWEIIDAIEDHILSHSKNYSSIPSFDRIKEIESNYITEFHNKANIEGEIQSSDNGEKLQHNINEDDKSSVSESDEFFFGEQSSHNDEEESEEKFFGEDASDASDHQSISDSDGEFFDDTSDKDETTVTQDPNTLTENIESCSLNRCYLIYKSEREFIFDYALPFIQNLFTVHIQLNKLDNSKSERLLRLLSSVLTLHDIPTLSYGHLQSFYHTIEEIYVNNIQNSHQFKRIKDILARKDSRLNDLKTQDYINTRINESNSVDSNSDNIVEGLKVFYRFCKNVLKEKEDIHNFSNLLKEDMKTHKSNPNTSLISRLIKLIGDKEYNTDSTFERDITEKILKVIRHILEEKADDEEYLIKVQNKFNDIGLTSLLLKLIPSEDERIVKESIQCAIALLLGGNSNVQESIYSYFKSNSRESENFFLQMKNRIKMGMSTIDEQREKSRQLQQQSYRALIVKDESHDKYNELENDNKDNLSMKDILRFLQLLCEGHNSNLQNYLRLQNNNLRTYNLVSETAHYLESLERYIDEFNVDIAIQTLITLTEYCQGPCFENQSDLIGTKLCESINYILQDQNVKCSEFKCIELQRVSLITLLSLIEGVGANSYVPNRMLSTLNFKLMECNLTSIIQEVSSSSNKSSDIYETKIELGFLYTFLLKSLSDFDKNGMIECILEKLPPDCVFNKELGRIEIIRQNNLEKLYFRIPKVCKYLTDHNKENLILNVDRSTQQEKIDNFFQIGEYLMEEMEHREKLENNKTFSWLSKNENTFKNLSFIFTLIINTIIILSYSTDIDDNIKVNPNAVLLLKVVSLIHLAYSSLTLVTYIVNKGPLIIKKEMDQSNNQCNDDYKWTKSIKKGAYLMKDTYFIYYCVYLLLSCLGVYYLPNAPYFFTFHLLDIVVRSEQLKHVIKSVTLNGKSLMLTACLAIVVVYIYSIFGFLFFRSSFQDEIPCSNMLMCLIMTINYGLRSGGGIGDVMDAPNWNERESTFRIFYDSSFFFIVVVLMLNMIQGIIIDTFGALRSQNKEIEEDIQNKCFICGIERATFDRYTNGFEHHITHEHPMFHYLYFCTYLKRKERTEYTGPEQYVADKIEAMDWSFIPNLKALSLENIKEKDDKTHSYDEANASYSHEQIKLINSSNIKLKNEMQKTYNEILEHSIELNESIQKNFEIRMKQLEEKMESIYMMLSNLRLESLNQTTLRTSNDNISISKSERSLRQNSRSSNIINSLNVGKKHDE